MAISSKAGIASVVLKNAEDCAPAAVIMWFECGGEHPSIWKAINDATRVNVGCMYNDERAIITVYGKGKDARRAAKQIILANPGALTKVYWVGATRCAKPQVPTQPFGTCPMCPPGGGR